MSIVTIPTSSKEAPHPAATLLIDADTQNEAVVFGPAAQNVGARITVIRTDNLSGGKTVTVAVSDASTINGHASIGITAQYDAEVFFSDGLAWYHAEQLNPGGAVYITEVLDSLGFTLLKFNTGGLASTNYVAITNADTGGPAEISAEGADTDIDLELSAKGTGVVNMHSPLEIGGVGVTADQLITEPDTTGVLDAPTKAVLDEIVADLKAAKVYAP